ncbi:MAG: flap endonuclease-1 [Candidatus Micrarchaeota archaeon]|nr:flap endonuclease-1 [Candidatus Micrarchaeota archaeon]
MAVDISKLVNEIKEPIGFEQLGSKTIAIDAYNTIYQFLSIIRQPDGSPLVDSKGRVTSHLSGLLYRTINLLEYRITPVFIFDGIPPVLKQKTLMARANARREAQEQWERARREGQIAEARMHAVASTKITKEVIESSKELLRYMGIAYLQAPSEGEAQAAALARKGLAYAIASQDYDSFLFGADVVIRNLTISGRRKLPMRNVYVNTTPERFVLEKLLTHLGISRKQLIWLGILIGTDFNGGIDKVGPMTALKIVKEHNDLDRIINYVRTKYNTDFDADPHEVEAIFLNPDVQDVGQAQFDEMMSANKFDPEKAMKFMCNEHDFSLERIEAAMEKLGQFSADKGQKDINKWLR